MVDRPTSRLLLALFQLFLFLPQVGHLIHRVVVSATVHAAVGYGRDGYAQLLHLSREGRDLRGTGRLYHLFFRARCDVDQRRGNVGLTARRVHVRPRVTVFFRHPNDREAVFLVRPLHAIVALGDAIRAVRRAIVIRANVCVLILVVRNGCLMLAQRRARRQGPRPILRACRRVLSPNSQLGSGDHLRPLGPSLNGTCPITLTRAVQLKCVGEGYVKVEANRPLRVLRYNVKGMKGVLPLPFPRPERRARCEGALRRLRGVALKNASGCVIRRWKALNVSRFTICAPRFLVKEDGGTR